VGNFFLAGHSIPSWPVSPSAGLRSNTIPRQWQMQSHISGGNGRLVCR
jgi:hypothetical protein